MTGLVELLIGLLAVVGGGGLAWVAKLKLGDARKEAKRYNEEARRLQDQQQKVVSDARERKAEEAQQRQESGAADRLRGSRWMRDD